MSKNQPVLAFLSLVLVAALALPACSAAPPPEAVAPSNEPSPAGAAANATAAPAANSCEGRAKKGESEVLPVVEANLVCATDTDCVTIGVGASCFDVCSRAVNKQGVAAVEKAEAQVNATTCATYKQDGCRFDVPPCMAPTAPKCRAGKCG